MSALVVRHPSPGRFPAQSCPLGGSSLGSLRIGADERCQCCRRIDGFFSPSEMLLQGRGAANITSQHSKPRCSEQFRRASFGPGCSAFRRITSNTIADGGTRQYAALFSHRAASHALSRAVLAPLLGILQLASPAFGAESAPPLTPAPAPVEQASPGAAAKPPGDRGSGKSAIVNSGEAPSLTQRVPSAKGTSTPAPPPALGSDRPQPGSKVPQDSPQPAADSITKVPSAERAPPPSGIGSTPKPPVKPMDDNERETKRLLDEEEERRKTRRRKKGRIRELEEIRAELAEKELVLLGKEQELLERDQTVAVLREELELEKKLRTLLTKEKEKAEEEAALAMGLCTGGSIF